MLDPLSTEQAWNSGAVAHRGVRDLITAAGPDAASYLQGQISQDVDGLSVGSSTWSLVLQPQGKVDGWFRLTRVSEDVFWLDLDAEQGEAVLARLERFKLRTAVEFGLEQRAWLAVRGPNVEPFGDLQALPTAWEGVAGFDLLGSEEEIDAALAVSNLDLGDPGILEAQRIRLGIPMHGRELTERTIPAETGIVDQSVSFTKGCYVGQELVARVDSRGNNTPRNLTGVRVAGGEALVEGAELTIDGAIVGTLTSVGQSATIGSVGLAYIKRGTDVPSTVKVSLASGEEVAADLVSLPF